MLREGGSALTTLDGGSQILAACCDWTRFGRATDAPWGTTCRSRWAPARLEKRDEPATSLSGGQTRRLEVARALAIRPSVILLDEPYANVDPISTGEIGDLVSGPSTNRSRRLDA
jgi:hypothetical protein